MHMRVNVSTVGGARSGKPERWDTHTFLKAQSKGLRRRFDKDAINEGLCEMSEPDDDTCPCCIDPDVIEYMDAYSTYDAFGPKFYPEYTYEASVQAFKPIDPMVIECFRNRPEKITRNRFA